MTLKEAPDLLHLVDGQRHPRAGDLIPRGAGRLTTCPVPSTGARGQQSIHRLRAADHDLLRRRAFRTADDSVAARSVHGADPCIAELYGDDAVAAVKAEGYSVTSHCSDEAGLHGGYSSPSVALSSPSQPRASTGNLITSPIVPPSLISRLHRKIRLGESPRWRAT